MKHMLVIHLAQNGLPSGWRFVMLVVCGLFAWAMLMHRAWSWWKRRESLRGANQPVRPLPRDPVKVRQSRATYFFVGLGISLAIVFILIDQFGSSHAKAVAHNVDVGVRRVMLWFFGIACVLVALLVLLYRLQRDPVIKRVAKLCLGSTCSACCTSTVSVGMTR
jgi:hypothetical protein